VTDVSRPQPISTVVVSPTVVTTIPSIQNELIKIFKIDATQPFPIDKIEQVTVTSNANVQIYYVKTVDSNNQSVRAEITYNPSTGQSTVVDLSFPSTLPIQRNITVVKGVSGVTETIIVNSPTITQGKEYQQISDFINRNHPNDNIQASIPVLSATEKYQRSVVRTLVFKQENSTIQASFLLDQRSQSIAELSYNVVPGPLVNEFALLIKKETSTFPADRVVEVLTTNTAVIKTLTSITKVDSTLSAATPTFVEIENYITSSVVTVVFETAQANSRILTIFNKTTGEAKVIDYSKIQKKIEESRIIETINQYGQKSISTNNLTAILSNKEYSGVISVAEELVPAIKGLTVRGVETTVKSTGTEYKIVVVGNGVVSQVNVFSDKTTGTVTLISSGQTSVG